MQVKNIHCFVKYVFLLFLLTGVCLYPAIIAGEDKLAGRINNNPNSVILLKNYYGEKCLTIDTLRAGDNGSFEYIFSKEFKTGQYRIEFGYNRFVDFFYLGGGIEIETDFHHPHDSLRFNNSPENRIYLEYSRRRMSAFDKLDLLKRLMENYPPSSSFRATLSTEFTRLRDEFSNYTNKAIKQLSGCFISDIIKLEKLPAFDPDMDRSETNRFMKEHFLDGFEIEDPVLLRTNALTGKILDYLALYRNTDYNREKQEEEFIKAAEVILENAPGKPRIYKYVVNFLIEGFSRYGFDRVIEFMFENYPIEEIMLDGQCSGEISDRTQRIISSFKHLKIGSRIPLSTFLDKFGNEFHIDSCNSKFRLLFFLSFDCPHCRECIGQLIDLKSKSTGNLLHIITLNVDGINRTDGTGRPVNLPPEWTNIEIDGWESDIAKAFCLHSTPSFFLLDKEGKIILKPKNVRDIIGFIK